MTADTRPLLLRNRADREARRHYLVGVLAQVTRELIDLDRADQKIPRIVEPSRHATATRNARARAWGEANGYHPSKAGRLSVALLDAYTAAHPEDPAP